MSNTNLFTSQIETLNAIRDSNRTTGSIRPNIPLIKKGSSPYFVNPLTGRVINNNTRSRYNVNRNIKKANAELEQRRITQQRNNKLVDASVINANSKFITVRVDTTNINTTRELFDFLFKNLNTGRVGYILNQIVLFFVNEQNQIINRTVNRSIFENSDDFPIFNAYINNLYNGEAIGSDSINSDEFKIDLTHIDFLYLESGRASGDSDGIIFDIEDVNNIQGNEKNQCISNSLKFIGHILPDIKGKFVEVVNSKGDVDVIPKKYEMNNVTSLIKYITEKKLPIHILSNSVQKIKFGGNRKRFTYGKYNLPKNGYNLNQCKYELVYLHETPFENPHLFIYNSKTKHIDVVKNNTITIPDNIYIEENTHIFIVENNKPKTLVTRNEVYDFVDFRPKNQNKVFYIFFDYETVVDWKMNNCMKEYSLSWFYLSHECIEGIIQEDDMKSKDFEFDNENCFNEIGFDCSEKFIEWFNVFQVNKICKFVSYNGANFDNYFLLNAFLKYQETHKNTTNITNLLYSGNQLLNFKINGAHNMYDLHKHLMGSLKNNCKSFKIPAKYSKLECDHREIQCIYNDDNDAFINTMKQKEALIDYNNNDVYSLACLFIKYYQSMSSIDGFDYLKGDKFCETGTIGSMIMKRARNMWEEDKIKLPKLSFEQYNDVLKYKIAGRVEIFGGKSIKLNEEVVSLDVCSLYPYIMAIHKCYMPCGQVKEVDEYQGHDVMGFYYCDIDQRALKEHNLPNIYAEKTETENKWDSQEILKDYLITNVTIKLLKKYENIGVVCDIKKGFVFTEKMRNIDLFKFLMPLMNIKNNEDTLKRDKDAKYNPALRECVKLLMNSVSGKVIEGLHSENIKMIQNAEDLLKLQSKEAQNKIKDINVINSVGENLFVSYKIDEETIINKQKPVYLGAFIYEYARSYMYENLLAVVGLDKCLYMDTDALKFRKADLAEWQLKCGNNIVNHWEEVEKVDKRYESHILFNDNSKVFGSLENELSENNVFYALQKKFWLTANIKNGEISYIKTRYKGISPSSLLLDNDCKIFETEKDKNKLNIQGLDLFNWIGKNNHLTIGSDYEENEGGFIGQQMKLFETLYNDREAVVLVDNMRRIVKNSLRSVKEEETERYNIYNNRVQLNYMIKTIKLN